MRPIKSATITTQRFRLFSLTREASYFLVLLVFVVALPLTALANPANLDPSFGNSGKVISSPDGSNTKWASASVLQGDGKIVVVGGGGNPGNFIVARYNSDGSLDTGFGTMGFRVISFPGESGASDVTLQAGGKIVVGGHFITPAVPGSSDVCVARLTTDGNLDTTFDGDGKATVSFDSVLHSGYFESLSSIRIAADGKVVISGHALFSATDDRFVLARLNADGSPDATFGSNGRFADASNGSGHNSSLADIVILPDGAIVAAGYVGTAFVNLRVVVKYSSAGTGRLWTYQDGVIGSTLPGTGHAFFGIAVLPDGKFIVVGKRAYKILAARINQDGTLDETFTDAFGMPTGQAIKVGVQADGKIVATYSGPTTSSFSVMRYNANGSLDTTFGAGGFASTALTSPDSDSARRLIVQPDGKILVVGSTYTLGTPIQQYFGMVRYRGGNFVAEKPLFDYDGDLKSDISVFRPSEGVWYLNRSTAGFTAVQWGASTDRIAPADYDGDGKTDITIYRNGDWWILQSSNSVVRIVNFGTAEDKPQPGDFDGDGRDDQAVFRPSNGAWYVFRSTDNGYHAVQFGASEDIPHRADYDDDGKVDLAIFRPSNGTWYVQKSEGGFLIFEFGVAGDIPVAADYDGDSNPDLAVWRPSSGDWYILQSSNGSLIRTNFGLNGDIPVPAEYNGDGKVDIAIFRPSTGVWYQRLTPWGLWAQQAFGLSGDRPAPSAFNP